MKKGFLTIQIVPDDVKNTRSFKIHYSLLRIIVLAIILLTGFGGFWIFHLLDINLLAFRAKTLAEKNKSLLENQEKINSLELVLFDLEQKQKAVNNIIGRFVSADAKPGNFNHIINDKNLVSRQQINRFLSTIDTLTPKKGNVAQFIPDIFPVNGIVTRGFEPDHFGIDIISKPNSVITSPANGVIQNASWKERLGNTIIIKHGRQYKTIFGHLNRMYVKAGDYVTKGKPIGTLGNTGISSGPHLHYEIHYDKKPVDPNTIIRN